MTISNQPDNLSRATSLDSSFEAECRALLDQSVNAMPASLHSRLSAIRYKSLDQLTEPSGYLEDKISGWRTAFAGLALCVLASGLLFLPNANYQTDQYNTSYSWATDDGSLLGDDLSLHLWLSELDVETIDE